MIINLTERSRRFPIGSIRAIHLAIIALCLAGSSVRSLAQSVVAPIAPENKFVPPIVRDSPNYVPSVTGNPLFSSAPLQWGPVAIRPHFVYRYLYGDGIQSSPGVDKKTSIQSVMPGIAFDFGKSWTFDYTPTWTIYSADEFRDTVDHSAVLVGAIAVGDWGFQLSQSYGRSSPALVETGGQTLQQSFLSALTLTYQLGSRTMINSTLNYDVQLAEGYPDSRTLSDTTGFFYQFSQWFHAGLSLGVGKVDRSTGSDMTFVQPQVQLTWNPTKKLTVSAQGGLENRKFDGDTTEDLQNPIMSATIDYRPLETTRVSFNVSRSVAASLFENQVTESDVWGVAFEQRLLSRLFFTADYNASKSSFVATAAGVTTNREDTTRSFNLRLRTNFMKRGSITLVYQEAHNSSSEPGFDFNSSQIGFELGYAY